MHIKYWKFYFAEILRGFWVTLPITTIFYLSTGLSFKDIGLFEGILAVIIFFTDIPFGMISDKIGHKKTSILGFSLNGFALLILAYFQSYAGFLAGFIIWGFSESLISGSYTSLLFEHVKKIGGSYTKIRLETSIFKGISVIIASICGAFLFSIRPNLPFIIYGIILFVLAIFLSSMSYSENKKQTHKHIISQAFKEIRKINIKFIFIYSILVFAIFQTFILLIQRPLILQKGFLGIDLGWIMAILFGIGWTAPYVLKKKTIHIKDILFLIPLIAVAFLLMTSFNGLYFLAIMVAFRIFKEINDLFIDIFLHENISTKSRASVFSIQSSLMNLVGGITVLITGYVLEKYSLNATILCLTIALSLLGVIFYINRIISIKDHSV